MKTNKANDLIEVFAGSSMEAEIIKSLLEDTEIKAFLKDEIMGTLAPWYVTAGGTGAVKVIVSTADYDKAKLVIEKNYKSLNIKGQ